MYVQAWSFRNNKMVQIDTSPLHEWLKDNSSRIAMIANGTWISSHDIDRFCHEYVVSNRKFDKAISLHHIDQSIILCNVKCNTIFRYFRIKENH